MKKLIAIFLALLLILSLCSCTNYDLNEVENELQGGWMASVPMGITVGYLFEDGNCLILVGDGSYDKSVEYEIKQGKIILDGAKYGDLEYTFENENLKIINPNLGDDGVYLKRIEE